MTVECLAIRHDRSTIYTIIYSRAFFERTSWGETLPAQESFRPNESYMLSGNLLVERTISVSALNYVPLKRASNVFLFFSFPFFSLFLFLHLCTSNLYFTMFLFSIKNLFDCEDLFGEHRLGGRSTTLHLDERNIPIKFRHRELKYDIIIKARSVKPVGLYKLTPQKSPFL